jgi:hypothetical protein
MLSFPANDGSLEDHDVTGLDGLDARAPNQDPITSLKRGPHAASLDDDANECPAKMHQAEGNRERTQEK